MPLRTSPYHSATNELTIVVIARTWKASLLAYIVVKVVFLGDHGNQLVAQNKGDDDSRNAPWQAETSWGEKVMKSGFSLVVHMRLSSKEQKFLQINKPYKVFKSVLNQFDPCRAYLLIFMDEDPLQESEMQTI